MAPKSYQGVLAHAEEPRTYSQTPESNLAQDVITVADLLREKGGIVYTIAPGETVRSAVHELRARRIGVVLVMEEDGIVGILSERDVVRRIDEAGDAGLDTPVSALMTPNPQTCNPSTPLLAVLRRMTDGRFRHLPVVEDGQLVGLVSIGDVVKARLRQLEYEALRMKQMIVG
ncbi:CBS domain-containing protein [Mangrovicoccus algicola]|uniref:CBS domain-containing protein n=1 Tax=Mangrovicoccus algicola TaxID=2771008 RepID=A0A8J7CUS3_9RHOB|nr:CBS domain-containing protein [Mangrovicoccus algicola]MBE3637874.1 CBS domain-containing protein [Mangrovicoccus algicola]